MDLMEWAMKNDDKELFAFLENVKSYQVIFFLLIKTKKMKNNLNYLRKIFIIFIEQLKRMIITM